MRVHLVINTNKCTSDDTISIRRTLTKFNCQEVQYPEEAELVVVLGGDGTIISTGRQLSSKDSTRKIPIAGVNFGKLGYLATFSLSSFQEYLRIVTSSSRCPDQFATSERMMLDIHAMDMTSEWKNQAVNDCVIDIGPPFRTTEIEIEINGYKFATLVGDGVIVSTPTGSTAYNMSAGGPIVQPELQGITLTPKNPHRLSVRPIVVASDVNIVIRIIKPEGVFAIIDGQTVMPMNTDSKITITKSSSFINLVQNADYWKTLTQKLNWGK